MNTFKKTLKIIVLLIIAIIILFTFIKPSFITLYCAVVTPTNKASSNDYFNTCLHESYLNPHSDYFLSLLDRIENKGYQVMDFLYYENYSNNKYVVANEYLKKWKSEDYKNGTFLYFGVEASKLEKLEEKNTSLQNDLIIYKKYSTNTDISSILEYYKNFLDENKKEPFYDSGVIFINSMN